MYVVEIDGDALGRREVGSEEGADGSDSSATAVSSLSDDI